jgi:uncharacterized protein (DUF1697 family)
VTATHVALLRGVNVGPAKRVVMADLRVLVTGLGYGDVRTVLNSGNVVFSVPETQLGNACDEMATRLEEELVAHLGVSARVTVLSAGELGKAVAGNPLLDIAANPSRLFVAFLADPAGRQRLESLAARDWAPEALALGARVAYLWCPEGMIASRLPEAVGRALGDAVTMRNWATVMKLQALVEAGSGQR